MRYYRPFCSSTWLVAAAAVTASVLVTSPLHAQVAQVDQHAALSEGANSHPLYLHGHDLCDGSDLASWPVATGQD
ncbi:hypothetical protein AAFX91_39495, partial [Bradyrhizobium sp. 31Argb]|uniref:hypothetical protein n=1 Tax=Bradyrhizobium sp. 31Argb TaxID=3141247 RepID=UPI003749E290